MASITNNNPKLSPIAVILIIFIVITAIIILNSCATKKVLETTTTSQTKTDTVFIHKKETLHDTVVKLKADSTYFEAYIECDSNNKAFIRRLSDLSTGVRVRTKIVFKHDTLKIKSLVGEDSIKVYWKDYWENQYREKINTTISDHNKEVKKSGSFWSALKWIIGALVVGFVLGITKKYWWPFLKGLLTKL